MFTETPKGYTYLSKNGHKYFISGVHKTKEGAKHKYWARSVSRMEWNAEERKTNFRYLSDNNPIERDKKRTILEQLDNYLTSLD